MRGEMVQVAIRNGGAFLETDAIAEGSGAAGETITVRNVTSQKHFTARVSGKGTVSVDASAGWRN
jgi:flagella basal body P-ring formation protein FlgA